MSLLKTCEENLCWLVERVFITVGIVIGLAVASYLVVSEILCKLINTGR